MYDNENFIRIIQWKNSDRDIVNLEDYTIQMFIRHYVGYPTRIASWSSSTSLITLTNASGLISINVPQATIAGLDSFCRAEFELKAISGGGISKVILEGFIIRKGIR